MSSSIQDFDFTISSIDEITHGVDDDVLDSILQENVLGTDEFDDTLEKFDDAFLGSLMDCNDQDSSSENIENLCSELSDKEAESKITELEAINQCFEPIDVDSLPVESSAALTKEQQIKNINEYSRSLQSTFHELKRSYKKKSKKPEPPFPTSSHYRDLSNIADEQVSLKHKSMVGRSQDLFPIKLHKIIDIIERDGLSSVVSWCAHGRAFKIHDNGRFIKEIMSKYFYQTKMSSFTRQLGT